jgi:HK97 family phage major capsid protein
MPTATADNRIRDELKRIQDEAADLRERRAAAKKERDAAKEAFAGADFSPGTNITETDEFHAAEQAVKRVGDLDDEIEAHRQSELALLKLVGDRADDNGHAGGKIDVARGRRGSWDANHLLRDSDAYADARQRGAFNSRQKFGTIELGQLATREETASFLRSRMLAQGDGGGLETATPGTVTTEGVGQLVRSDDRGLVPFRLPTLIDIFPTGTTDAPLIEYVQVVAVPGSADVVAEGERKPEQGLELKDESAKVVTIAGWIKVNRNAMNDAAGLAAMINQLLPFDVRRKLIGQVIAGDGTGENMRGIYETTGVGSVSQSGTDNIADAFLRGMTVVILSLGEPNFAAVNPLTWQDLLLMKNAQGNYLYGSPGVLPGGMVAQTVWGMTLTTSPSIPQDKPLVGDSQGAMILVREGVNVRTSDSDQDDFIRNRVTILAETRAAFVVWRPSDFCIVELSGGNGGNGGS